MVKALLLRMMIAGGLVMAGAPALLAQTGAAPSTPPNGTPSTTTPAPGSPSSDPTGTVPNPAPAPGNPTQGLPTDIGGTNTLPMNNDAGAAPSTGTSAGSTGSTHSKKKKTTHKQPAPTEQKSTNPSPDNPPAP